VGDTLNITCNFMYCNHQVRRDFLITLYKSYISSYFKKKILYTSFEYSGRNGSHLRPFFFLNRFLAILSGIVRLVREQEIVSLLTRQTSEDLPKYAI